MIRAVAALFCFALVLCAYIVLRPFSAAATPPQVDLVTRADTPVVPLQTDESSMQAMPNGSWLGWGCNRRHHSRTVCAT